MGNFTLEHLKLIISGIISKFPKPDWKQNDPSHPNYIKNRTHYDITRYETLECEISVGGYIDKKYYDLVDEKVYNALLSNTSDVANILVDGLPLSYLDASSYSVRYQIDNYRTVNVAPDYKNRIYVMDSSSPDGTYDTVKLEYTYSVEDAKKLDEKYLPENVVKVSKAKKGQQIIVKEVDKKGKPTDWECIDVKTPVQANYTQTDSSQLDYIKNKPTNLVKYTDYATSSKVGLVRTNASYGTYMSGQYIQTYSATQSDIDSKTSDYRPITPNRLDYAVRAGLSKNKLTWTETEKKNARNLIGAASKSDLSNVQNSLNNIEDNLNNIEVCQQSDWEQGDFDSPDFVKNRTHYDCNIKKVIKYNINYGGNLSDWTDKTKFSSIDESLHQELLNTTVNSTGITLNGVNVNTPTNSWQYDIVTIKVTSYISLFVHLYYPLVYASNIDSPVGIQGSIELAWNYEKPELKQLDEKYIPDNIPKVNVAEVGQILSVKEVDEDGKPIKWEVCNNLAYHLPSSKFIEKGDENGVENIAELNIPILIQDLSSTNQSTITNVITPQTLLDTGEDAATNFTDYNFIGKIVTYLKTLDLRAPMSFKDGKSLRNYTLNMIDDYNFEFVQNNFKFTFIIKTDSLTEENKSLYPVIGVYLTKLKDSISIVYISAGISFTNTLEDVFLDSNIPRKTWVNNQLSGKISSPTTASVGQTLVVKTVDENNKPIEWETIDKPTGGDVDLSEYVKFTDIATKSKAGVARIFGTGDKDVPGVGLTGNNILGIVRAKEEEIDQKTNASKPIVPSTLDYAVKSGLTTNALEWTDEEKQAARDLIGASDSGIEITDGEPTKASTVMTLNPNAEEVNLYTAEEIDAKIKEWKLLTSFTVEEEISSITITETDSGESFVPNDLFVAIKAVKRTEVSSLKVFGKNGINEPTLAQTNNFGNTSKDMYYVFLSEKIGKMRRYNMVEHIQNVFSSGITATAAGVYNDGTTYATPSSDCDQSYLRLLAAKMFLVGDIIEIWYK